MKGIVKDFLGMTYNFDLNTRLKDLGPALDEYTEWFMQLTRQIFYPNSKDWSADLSAPRAFLNWLEQQEKDAFFDQAILSGLHKLHGELFALAQKMIKSAEKRKSVPDFDEYDRLTMFFEEFILRARRIEKDCVLEDSGIDTFTGLRSRHVMQKDIMREMDRLARRGKAFSIALLRVDDFDEVQKGFDAGTVQSLVRFISDMIRCSVRSFDDAYYMDNGLFILSLKQTDTQGGIRALQRLRTELEKKESAYKMQDFGINLSLSSCVAEPLPGDNILELLENLKTDLDECRNESGAVLEYFEVSPLQRYVQQEDRKS